jgi:hypothetical protein
VGEPLPEEVTADGLSDPLEDRHQVPGGNPNQVLIDIELPPDVAAPGVSDGLQVRLLDPAEAEPRRRGVQWDELVDQPRAVFGVVLNSVVALVAW